MPSVSDYVILQEERHALRTEVLRLLSNGWTPLGAPIREVGSIWWYQAMIKEEDGKEQMEKKAQGT